MPHDEEDKGDYIKVTYRKDKVPAAGACGFFFRKKLFDKVPNDPFVHPLFVYDLINKGHTKIAKVKQGIRHVQNGSIKIFFKKKIRRIERRQKGEIDWKYNYDLKQKEMVRISLYIASIVLLLRDSIRGFIKKPSTAWVFHPVATLGLLFIYGYYALVGLRLK